MHSSTTSDVGVPPFLVEVPSFSTEAVRGKRWIPSSNKRNWSLMKLGSFSARAFFPNSGTVQQPILEESVKTPAPVQTQAYFSGQRLFEQKLTNLHKCANFNELKQIHALIYRSNLHEDPYVAPKLISALSLCCRTALAVNVFDQVPNPNAHLYNTLIKAHILNSEPLKAFDVFYEMMSTGTSPDNFTYLFILKACSELELVGMVHTHVEKFKLHSDLFLHNSLIDAYSKCGIVGVRAARKVFDTMDEKDVVTYNSMISGLVRVGMLQEAKGLFHAMPQRDRVSWNTILDGHVKAGKITEAFELFNKMPSRDVVSWSTVMTGYAKTGDIEMARVLFDKMPVKNLVPWTILISGYAEKGFVKEAIGLYEQMEKSGLKFDDGIFVSILSSSAESCSLCLGKRVHRSIRKSRHKCSILVNNALIDMYGKCGCLNQAWNVFNGMDRKDLVSWNAMIHGLAMHGDELKALQLFDRMKQEGYVPDKVTFVGVLSACSHAGMVEEGISNFYDMEKDYKIAPEIQHYGCLIDLLGRHGHLIDALKLVHTMPFEPNAVILGSLLGACRICNDVQLEEQILGELIKLGPIDA